MMNVGRLSDRSSAAVGLVLLLPALMFVTSNILKYELGMPFLYEHLGFFSNVQSSTVYDFLSPVLFLGGTAIALALNLLSTTQISLAREVDSIVGVVRFRPKPFNVSIIVSTVLVLGMLVLYLIVENAQHLA